MTQKTVFPAYAGMIPRLYLAPYAHLGVPRIRGDDPLNDAIWYVGLMCSPHTRG